MDIRHYLDWKHSTEKDSVWRHFAFLLPKHELLVLK